MPAPLAMAGIALGSGLLNTFAQRRSAARQRNAQIRAYNGMMSDIEAMGLNQPIDPIMANSGQAMSATQAQMGGLNRQAISQLNRQQGVMNTRASQLGLPANAYAQDFGRMTGDVYGQLGARTAQVYNQNLQADYQRQAQNFRIAELNRRNQLQYLQAKHSLPMQTDPMNGFLGVLQSGLNAGGAYMGAQANEALMTDFRNYLNRG